MDFFAIDSRFNKEKALSAIRFGQEATLLEAELHELQDIQNSFRQEMASLLFSSSIVKAASLQTNALANSFKAGIMDAFIMGYPVHIENNNDEPDNLVILSAPPETGTRYDLVYMELWFETIDYLSNIYRFGGEASGTVPNDLVDYRIGAETSRRVQLRWRIASVDGIDFTSYPKGVNAPSVKAKGANSHPVEWNFAAVPGDSGLFIAGSGDGPSKTLLETRDGYSYAIPLFKVVRSAGKTAITLEDIMDIRVHARDVTPLQIGAVPLVGGTMTGALTLSGDPTQPLHAATKQYVDAARLGLDCKESVRVATTGNITLSGLQTIDGIALSAGDRVLVKNQNTASQNGIYIAASSAWARAEDANTSSKVTPGLFTFVEQGNVNADSGWILTTDRPITLGSTGLTFVQFSGAGQLVAQDGLYQSGNLLGVSDSGISDSKIGLRTLNQGLASPTNSGNLTQLLSWLAGRIKTIAGTTNWYDTPSKTISQLAGEKANLSGAIFTGPVSLTSFGGSTWSSEKTPSGVFTETGLGWYIREINNISGYPYTYGTMLGYANSSNSYKYCFQVFKGSDGPLYYRQATSSSVWTSWAQVWTGYNDGAGSGLDADKLDGYQSNTGTVANTIPVRDSSGKIPGSITGDAATVGGKTLGTEIPLKDGTVQTNLNADMVDGKHANNTANNIATLDSSGNLSAPGGTVTLGTFKIVYNSTLGCLDFIATGV